MRCGRMRCGDIWRCGGKRQKPSKPGFTYIDFWGVSGDPLVGQERNMFITCEPIVDDEPIVEVDNPSIARLIRVEDNSTEWGKYYNAYFDILAEGDFAVTVKSKNNPSVMNAKMYHSITPTPVETFSFNEDTITIPENRTVFTSATFTPSDAYVWQGLDINTPEGDTSLQVYNGVDGYINLYGTSNAPAGAMRTLSARSFGGPVLDTVEAEVVEVVEPVSVTFVEHNITLTSGQEVSPEVIKTPSDTNVNLMLTPNDWGIVSRGFTPFSIVGQNAGTTQVELVDWDTGVVYDTCTVTVEAPVYPTIEFVDGDTEINVGETGTLRFRYTNATGFSANGNPSVANITNTDSDEEYCYVTYEGVGAGQANIQCVAWNGDNPSDARVLVTVIGEQPTNPVITLLEADTSIATGQYGMARFTITGSDYQNVGVEDSNIVETWSAGWNDEVYEFVYKGINEGTTNIFVSARNDEGGATTYPVTINVIRHPGPGITFDHGDTEINVGETGVLAFRTINADRYTYNSDDPSIASVTTITDDPRFVYYTYQGNNVGQTYIYGIVIDAHDDTAQAGVQVTVNGSPQPQPEPITAISQFSTDYRCNVGDTGNWNLGTVTPSENGDINSLSYDWSQGMAFGGCDIVDGNTLIGQITREEAGDKTFQIQLQNGNIYGYTFHVAENIPVESFDEDLGASIEIPEGQRGQMQFRYTPTNATNFNGLSWTSTDIEVADVGGFWYNDGTLFQYIDGRSEGTCTITGSYNNVPFTTINVTVVPAVPYEISGLSEQSVTATVGTQRDVNVSGNSNANDFDAIQVTSSDDNVARVGFSGRIDSFGNSTLYIHPQSEGTCTITISDGTNSYTCEVTVAEQHEDDRAD